MLRWLQRAKVQPEPHFLTPRLIPNEFDPSSRPSSANSSPTPQRNAWAETPTDAIVPSPKASLPAASSGGRPLTKIRSATKRPDAPGAASGAVSDEQLVLDYLGLLGQILIVCGVYPAGCGSRCSGRGGGRWWRWVPLGVYVLLVLSRLTRALGCASTDADAQLEDRFFGIIFCNSFAGMAGLLFMTYGRHRMVAHSIEASRALLVSMSQAAELEERMEAHRQLVRHKARRLGRLAIGFCVGFMTLINFTRLWEGVQSTIDGTSPDFGYRCDPALVRAFSPIAVALYLTLTDLVIYGFCIVFVAVALWVMSMYAHMITDSLSDVVDSIAKETRALADTPVAPDSPSQEADMPTVPERQRRFSITAEKAMEIARRLYIQDDEQSDVGADPPRFAPPAQVLASDLRFELDFLGVLNRRFVPVAKVIALVCSMAMFCSGIMIVPASIQALRLENVHSATLFGFFGFALAFAAAGILTAQGAKVLRHYRELQERARDLLQTLEQLIGDNGQGELGLEVRPEEEPGVSPMATMPAHSRRVRHNLAVKHLVAMSHFWERFRPVYFKLLLLVAGVTAALSCFLVANAFGRMPDCAKITLHEGSLATYDTDDCSTKEVSLAYMAGVLLVGIGSVAAPLVLTVLASSFSRTQLKDIIAPGVLVIVVATVLLFMNGLTIRDGKLSRAPGFLGYLVITAIIAYRLHRPGAGVDREPLSKRAACLYFLIFFLLVGQVVFINALFVLVFVFAPEEAKFAIVLVAYPAVSITLRFTLSALCEAFHHSTSGTTFNVVALYCIGHAYLSLIGRELLIALGTGDQVLAVVLWAMLEVGSRSLGLMARPALMYAFLPEGERRDREMARAEQQRLSEYIRSRIYGRMFCELVAISGAVATALVLRNTLSDPEDHDHSDHSIGHEVSTGDLVLSMFAQFFFEIIADSISVIIEEKILERRVLSLWEHLRTRQLSLVALYGLLMSVGVAFIELAVVLGKFEKVQHNH